MRGAGSARPRLDGRARARFIGDLHLGDGGSNDPFGARDGDLARSLGECEGACDAVVFMGDTFDVPQAWSVRRILVAHREAIRAIERLCQRVPVFFVRGNHDWSVDYARIFRGARTCEELIVGEALVMHGHQLDRYCHPDRRLHVPKTALHHLAERALGFHFRVPLWEHDTWQNRAAHWLGGQYGRHLRRMARIYRMVGLDGPAGECEAFIRYWSRAVWGDPHDLFEPASALVRHGPHRALVCGHAHLPGVVDLGGAFYVNAGSWTFGASQIATWDGARFAVTDGTSADPVGDRHYRWMVAGEDPGDFFSWWAAHYRGWLRFAPSAAGERAASRPLPDRGDG